MEPKSTATPTPGQAIKPKSTSTLPQDHSITPIALTQKNISEFVSWLQSAVTNDDRSSIAKSLLYPVPVNLNGVPTRIVSEQDFLDHYEEIFDQSVKDAIQNQDPSTIPSPAWWGTIIGKGEIKFTSYCTDDDCNGQFEECGIGIIDINNCSIPLITVPTTTPPPLLTYEDLIDDWRVIRTEWAGVGMCITPEEKEAPIGDFAHFLSDGRIEFQDESCYPDAFIGSIHVSRDFYSVFGSGFDPIAAGINAAYVEIVETDCEGDLLSKIVLLDPNHMILKGDLLLFLQRQ